MLILIIAWIVFIRGIISTAICLKKTFTDKETISRVINFFVGVTLEVMTVIISYYLIFIK